ncbi:hypothetical protein CLV42_109193 [Chitinophaga ginsengisoli]|uniref:Uncharacterized protein n=1 Tax=Chitinophaga ginsengisoli TaxID=363837 RepID=A0A2P8G107_9BACT|nr:hypothetical protein CLV42_109193 [Chitinophaga ginsengisoli]
MWVGDHPYFPGVRHPALQTKQPLKGLIDVLLATNTTPNVIGLNCGHSSHHQPSQSSGRFQVET